MQIAAADPQFLRKEDVTPELLEKEKEIARDRARAEGKPEKILDKIVEGRLSKYYEEVCLYEQPFIKDNAVTVGQLIATKVGKLGENISIARFVRMKVGDTATGAAGHAEPASAD
jgi:elongation factor Ts